MEENPTQLFGYSFLIVTTGSMEPEINSGELVIIKKYEKYKNGDIITYLDNDGFLVTHRIEKIDDTTVITKGDNNNIKDEECLVDNIKGKVIFHSKILGFFVLYLLKPLIIIYIVFLIITNFICLYKDERSKENEDEKNITN